MQTLEHSNGSTKLEQVVTKFRIEEIPNPRVTPQHKLVTPYDGLMPEANQVRGCDATGYALPNKGKFMFDSLYRPVDIYRKEMAKDGKPVWVKIGEDHNKALFQLINDKRLDRLAEKEQEESKVILNRILGGPVVDIPMRTLGFWERMVVRRMHKIIDERRVYRIKVRDDYFYTQPT